MADAPNLLKIDAFKSVIDAALAFDALYLPDHGEVPEPLSREEAEMLADYAETCIKAAEGEPPHMRSLAAMASIVASASYLDATLKELAKRCGGGES
jgi:hypothetical protein